MNRQPIIFVVFSVLFLSACAPKPTQRHLQLHEAATAESLMQSGQHKQAANLYQTLANSQPTYKEDFRLLAAQAYIQSGDIQAAQDHLNLIDTLTLSSQQRNNFNLLNAEISLSLGETEKALDQLNNIQVYNLQPDSQITYYQSLAFTHSLMGNPVQSAEARIQLTPLFQDSQLAYQNKRVILNTLNSLSSQELILNQPPIPNTLGGWMALTHLLKTTNPRKNPTEFYDSLQQWQYVYPQHPANSEFLQTFLEDSKHHFKIPTSIALLIPESGRFAKAAQVVKQGFMSAYHHSQSGFQPALRTYDSASANVVSLYHQAIAEGAELIVGPLSRDNIQNLALGTELTTPVLALNHVQNLSKDNLFQFGLSPIDETVQIAHQANQDGNKKVVILTPENNQGQRIAEYLTENWQETGGTVLEHQPYNPKVNDFSQPIKKLLNLDESRYRYTKLKQVLSKNIEYSERRRQDFDAIFISARPRTARSLYPQLQFYRANRVPVYATSHIYGGRATPSLDVDLNGITFCDIPWLFSEAYSGDLNQESMRSSWQHLPSSYIKLLALGIDAFDMIQHMPNIDVSVFPGATGILSINSENRITRQLVCASFAEGQPVLQNYITQETETFDDDMVYSDDNIE